MRIGCVGLVRAKPFHYRREGILSIQSASVGLNCLYMTLMRIKLRRVLQKVTPQHVELAA